MGSLSADFSGFKTTLFELVDERATGTLFVATADNHSAQIVLSRGQLLGVAHHGMHNETALEQLAAMTPLRFSFTPELIYPLTETLLPEQGDRLLNTLGYRKSSEHEERWHQNKAGLSAPVTSSTTLRVYRGRVIQG
ncbi:hypothetical protein [Marinobacterium sediminicola]|uniref:DUF4388 domain-containing protein n=1 Tax=Marinobacterium sediminicola TaxID=518898 RepID=A0ABY1S166_9GAMM|nr:hypothetical protein [Marinobacterium sediminicola]ULG69770.1 hypothetical protein LN244_02870 [Marinobacterium sediminicola]SMR75419.1 hypothetical protein SAMN04487964_10985 [Marinobacterium sediminicola]